MHDLTQNPQGLPYWRIMGTVLQVAVGATFGMVAGQAIAVAGGRPPTPPGAFAWGGLILGGIAGGISHHLVAEARTVYA